MATAPVSSRSPGSNRSGRGPHAAPSENAATPRRSAAAPTAASTKGNAAQPEEPHSPAISKSAAPGKRRRQRVISKP